MVDPRLALVDAAHCVDQVTRVPSLCGVVGVVWCGVVGVAWCGVAWFGGGEMMAMKCRKCNSLFWRHSHTANSLWPPVNVCQVVFLKIFTHVEPFEHILV